MLLGLVMIAQNKKGGVTWWLVTQGTSMKYLKYLKWSLLLLGLLIAAELVERTLWQPVSGSADIVSARKGQRSGVWLTTEGTVDRLLEDDREGSQHQRFLLSVSPQLRVLVAHNIDLADRVPVQRGDRVELRGRYEWNSKGGVLHWTHHDPGGRHPGGWIRFNGRQYR